MTCNHTDVCYRQQIVRCTVNREVGWPTCCITFYKIIINGICIIFEYPLLQFQNITLSDASAAPILQVCAAAMLVLFMEYYKVKMCSSLKET
jgi:hypothetical protein